MLYTRCVNYSSLKFHPVVSSEWDWMRRHKTSWLKLVVLTQDVFLLLVCKDGVVTGCDHWSWVRCCCWFVNMFLFWKIEKHQSGIHLMVISYHAAPNTRQTHDGIHTSVIYVVVLFFRCWFGSFLEFLSPLTRATGCRFCHLTTTYNHV